VTCGLNLPDYKIDFRKSNGVVTTMKTSAQLLRLLVSNDLTMPPSKSHTKFNLADFVSETSKLDVDHHLWDCDLIKFLYDVTRDNIIKGCDGKLGPVLRELRDILMNLQDTPVSTRSSFS
jgi:hypothetical protein